MVLYLSHLSLPQDPNPPLQVYHRPMAPKGEADRYQMYPIVAPRHCTAHLPAQALPEQQAQPPSKQLHWPRPRGDPPYSEPSIPYHLAMEVKYARCQYKTASLHVQRISRLFSCLHLVAAMEPASHTHVRWDWDPSHLLSQLPLCQPRPRFWLSEKSLPACLNLAWIELFVAAGWFT